MNATDQPRTLSRHDLSPTLTGSALLAAVMALTYSIPAAVFEEFTLDINPQQYKAARETVYGRRGQQ